MGRIILLFLIESMIFILGAVVGAVLMCVVAIGKDEEKEDE